MSERRYDSLGSIRRASRTVWHLISPFERRYTLQHFNYSEEQVLATGVGDSMYWANGDDSQEENGLMYATQVASDGKIEAIDAAKPGATLEGISRQLDREDVYPRLITHPGPVTIFVGANGNDLAEYVAKYMEEVLGTTSPDKIQLRTMPSLIRHTTEALGHYNASYRGLLQKIAKINQQRREHHQAPDIRTVCTLLGRVEKAPGLLLKDLQIPIKGNRLHERIARATRRVIGAEIADTVNVYNRKSSPHALIVPSPVREFDPTGHPTRREIRRMGNYLAKGIILRNTTPRKKTS